MGKTNIAQSVGNIFKRSLFISLLLTLMAGCAHPTANQIAGKVPWPSITPEYQALLMKAGPKTAQEAIKHELDWQGWAEKMENRVGY